MVVRKRSVVPSDALNRYVNIQLQKPENKDPALTALSRMDEQMSQVLYDPTYTTETKVKLFQDLFRRYRAVNTPLEHIATAHRTATATIEQQTENPGTAPAPVQPIQALPHQKPSLLRALGYVPKNRKANASMLIDFLVQHPGISWTDEYKLRLHDKVYQNSNMFDLIKEIMRDKTRKTVMPPAGIVDLVQLLANSNVPQDAVINKDIKDYMYDDPANLELSPYARQIFREPGASTSGRRSPSFSLFTPKRGRGIKWKSY